MQENTERNLAIIGDGLFETFWFSELSWVAIVRLSNDLKQGESV
jgi:hypothetical protein